MNRATARPRRAVFFDLVRASYTAPQQRLLEAAARAHRDMGDLLVAVGPAALDGPTGADIVLDPDEWVSTVGRECDTRPGSPCTRSLAVVEAIARLGLDAAQCFGYGDPCDGGAVLSIVGNPRAIAFTPEAVRAARRRGWPIVTAPPLGAPAHDGPPLHGGHPSQHN
jgi:hypothetical protein